MQRHLQRSRHAQIRFERLGLVHQHVRSRRRETLIVHHVRHRHILRDVAHERHGFVGIADVLIERVAGPDGASRGQLSAGLEVERLRLRFLGRPLVVLVPFVAAGLEHVGFRQLRIAFPLQVIKKEWKLDIVAIELGRLGVERDRPETVAVAARPAAVNPRTHHNHVVRARALLLRRTRKAEARRTDPRRQTSRRPSSSPASRSSCTAG